MSGVVVDVVAYLLADSLCHCRHDEQIYRFGADEKQRDFILHCVHFRNDRTSLQGFELDAVNSRQVQPP